MDILSHSTLLIYSKCNFPNHISDREFRGKESEQGGDEDGE